VTKRRRRARWLLLPAALYLLLLADWRPGPRPAAPVLLRHFTAAGALRAGAARVVLDPPLPIVRAGYGPRKATATRTLDPLAVRAVVVASGGHAVALVLADVVLVPDALARDLERRLADLGLDGVLFAGTHTHSSFGGFDARPLAQLAGTGRYRPEVAEVLAARAAAAVRAAHARLRPATLSVARDRLSGWAENRSRDGAPVDDALTVLRLDGPGGAPVATVAVVAAHATQIPRTEPVLSAEYPGAAMRRLEGEGDVALLLQGAEGDARPPGMGAAAVEAAGRYVADHVAAAARAAAPVPPTLGYAAVEVGLPPAEPQMLRSFFLRRPAANLLWPFAPRATRVTVLSLGGVILLCVPGEPTAEAAARLAGPAPSQPDRIVRVVGVAGGYVGYVEVPERVRAGAGEGRRAWLGPDLLDALAGGLRAGIPAALTPR